MTKPPPCLCERLDWTDVEVEPGDHHPHCPLPEYYPPDSLRFDLGGGLVIDTEPATVRFSATMPAEWSDELAAEALRQRMTPSELIREYVKAGLAAREPKGRS